ncbi:MAG: gliding motility-associated C-terminal domain-containing protein [Bacteroidales bacterium]|nr:gliding motility-associated C-terminal domain-containing protein [Bacteroidales bacterium]
MPRQSFQQVRAIRSFTIPPAEYDTSLTYLWNTGDTTPYIQVTPSQTTTYTVTVTNEIGCQNSESQTILVAQSMPQNIYEQICQGEPYEANGFSLTADETSVPGNILRTRTVMLNGCSSFVTLILTVLPMDTTVLDVSSCGPYNWHGQTYYQDGTYTQRFSSQSGCDSVAVLHLTIHTGDTTYLAVDTCDGYQWFGQTYPYSGIYTHILQNQHGCDSTLILDLTVRDAEVTYYTQTVCESELPATWHNITLDQEGVYTFYAINSQGCDSIERLTLTVIPPVYTYQTVTAYGYYQYGDSVWNTSGSHAIHHTAQNGCDSVVVLTLVILQPDPTYVDSTVCAGALPLVWNGLLFAEAGTQTATLHPTPYYDSLVVMTLNVLPVPATLIDTSVCELFVWNGVEYDESGTYEQTFTAENGCDSLVTVELSVFYSEMTEADSLVCPASLPLIWNGKTFTGPGQQTAQLLTSHQCDSLVVMTVTVGDTTARWTDTTVCDLLDFHGTVYTASGLYEQQLTNGDGCPYIHHVGVTVYQSDTTYLDTSVCNSSFPFVWHGLTFVNAGTKSLTLQNSDLCDSVLVLTVDRLNISMSNVDTASCGPLEWNGQTFTQSATTNLIVEGSNGCDSIIFAHITIFDSHSAQHDTTVCSADLPLLWRGRWFTGEDSVVLSFTTAHQCDSVETLVLHVTESPDTLFADTVVCASQLPMSWRGVLFTGPGTQTHTYTESGGCTGVQMLHLQTYDTPTPVVSLGNLAAGTGDTVAIGTSSGHASGYSFAVSGPWAGLWHDTLLVVSPPGTLTHDTAASYTVTLTDSNGCVAETTVTAHFFIPYQLDLYDTVEASQLPYMWQGTPLVSPCVQTAHLTSQYGADSTVTLHLSVLYQYDTLFCNAATPLTWHGATFTESGSQTTVYPVAPGADSIVAVSVTIGFAVDTTLWATVLENELPVTISGIVCDSAGCFVHHVTTPEGCVRTVTLYLTVFYNVETAVDSVICPEQLPFTWNGKTFTAAGTQSAVLAAASGADSTVVMTVTVWPAMTTAITGSSFICPQNNVVLTADSAAAYHWSTGATSQTVTVSQPGTYSVTVTDSNGCSAEASHTIASSDIDGVAAVNAFEMCAGNNYSMTIGYSNTATVQLAHGVSSLALAETIFLPDGVSCPPYGCSYRSPLTFTDFAPNASIQSVNDILFVRLNMEHSYIGDLYINITCPNGQKAHILKYGGSGTSNCNQVVPSGAIGWQSGSNMNRWTFLGNAYDYESLWDDCNPNASGNQPGTGWNYCWSNNSTEGYSYAPGAGSLIYRSANAHNDRVDSSNVAAGTHFYHPDQSFSNLIGCPLNGSWYIEVVDAWSGDNGYIFGWELALDPSLLPVSSNPVTSATVDGPWVQPATDTTFTITPPSTLAHDTLASYVVHFFDDYGCTYDTIITLPVHVQTALTIDTTVLENALPLVMNGQSMTDTGTYVQHLNNAHGCDSTLTVHLNVLHNVHTAVDSAVCASQYPLTWNGKLFTAAGTQNSTLTAANGVDSVVTMTVSTLPSTDTVITATIVENQLPYVLNGVSYQTTGVYTQPLTNGAGCDSTITLNLTVYLNTSATFDTTVCATELPYTWRGHTFTAAGQHTYSLNTLHGADSTVHLHLSADQMTTSIGETTHVLCHGDSTGGAVAVVTGGQSPLTYQWTNAAGATLSSSTTLSSQPAGTYLFTVTDPLGCAATASVTLNTLSGELTPGTIADDQNLCGSGTLEPFTGNAASGGDQSAYQWQISTDGTTWAPAPGSNDGQDYIYPDVASDNLSLRRAWISQACGTVYSNTVNVYVWSYYNDTITVETCQNVPCQIQGFDIPAEVLSQPGEHRFEQLFSTGHCDSLIVLILIVNPQYNLHFEDEICEGEGYLNHGFSISPLETVGQDLLQRNLNLQTEKGCDSIVELRLSIIDTSLRIVPLTEYYCEDHTAILYVNTEMENYLWSTGETSPEITVTESGTYSVTVSQNSCVNSTSYQLKDCELILYLPNTITPGNGDGLNDEFFLPERYHNQIDDFEILIYNRWGSLIYQSRDKQFRWDGTVNGKLMRDNIYSYIIRCTNPNGRPLLFKGTITIL